MKKLSLLASLKKLETNIKCFHTAGSECYFQKFCDGYRFSNFPQTLGIYSQRISLREPFSRISKFVKNQIFKAFLNVRQLIDQFEYQNSKKQPPPLW